MASELTAELRAALDTVPDEWTPSRDVGLDSWDGVRLWARHLIDIKAGDVGFIRRTPAGRAALGSGG